MTYVGKVGELVLTRTSCCCSSGCSFLNVYFCAVSVIGLLVVDAVHKSKELNYY
jgi:hypothetical protein